MTQALYFSRPRFGLLKRSAYADFFNNLIYLIPLFFIIFDVMTNRANPQIKIMIAEDMELFRQSIASALREAGIDTVAEASNGNELLRQLETVKPDVILLDLRMPELDGNKTMGFLMERYPGIKVIILSAHDEQVLIDDYMLRGAKGYVPKNKITGDIDELAAAIRIVHRGGINRYHQAGKAAKKMTVRHKEIITQYADGKLQKEIAENLKVTRSGIAKAEQKIMSILGVGTKGELKTTIIELGLNFLGRGRSRDSPAKKTSPE